MDRAQLVEMYLIALADSVLLVRLLYLGYSRPQRYPFSRCLSSPILLRPLNPHRATGTRISTRLCIPSPSFGTSDRFVLLTRSL
jgi:hypothetical protein